ncbi:MAG: hypothetical protein ACKOL0_02260 [Solirubrobacterales bacterium]
MESLGVRSLDELIGRTDLLDADRAIDHWKARGVDLSALLDFPAGVPEDAPRHQTRSQEPVLEGNLDWSLIERSGDALEGKSTAQFEAEVRNVDRCVGGILSHQIATLHGSAGLPPDSIEVEFTGSAGQSFGGWLAPGVSFSLAGDVNDYVGKGLSGGTLSVHPREGSGFRPSENVIAGNTSLYGATAGKAFFRGVVGERFAVRNSGASAVVEGVGDHGCEYMTGGRVVVLGPTGRNFAAGMSGGIAYVFDPDEVFDEKVNPAMANQIEEPSDGDLEEVRELLEEHVTRTDSDVAAAILADWEGQSRYFVKVFPTDYKRVLAELEAEDPGDSVGAGASNVEGD